VAQTLHRILVSKTLVILHHGVDAPSHVMKRILALTMPRRLLWNLIHIHAHVLLPALARGPAVLSLIVET
jgi:hypothetical protein